MDLGTLAEGLGSFPLVTEPYRPMTASRTHYRRHSEFVWVW